MKAFEKLEKTQQRKQEQKTAKTSSPKKPRNTIQQKTSLVNAQKRKMISQKRKKRKSKTLHTPRKSESSKHSGESDVASSSEETRHQRPGPSLDIVSNYTQSQNNFKMSSSEELLLSYSQFKSEPDSNLSGIPPLISPACMLIESAIGNLEQSTDNEFKFPKTKPKKSIMNEWYGKQEDIVEYKQPDYKVNFKPDINIVAAKVEEFLDRNNIRYGDEEPLALVKSEFKATTAVALTTPPQANSPQTEGTSFGSESAVKKRWLRQAISEETADESNASQMEFSTPLKKRRVFIAPEGESPTASQDAIVAEPKVETAETECEDETPNSSGDIKTEEDTTVSSTVAELPPCEIIAEAAVEYLENPIKVEEDPPPPPLPVQAPVVKEEEPLDEDNKSSNSEEMAEYQKVIASFHNENIMMLQTRNKKSKSFSAEPEERPSPTKTKLSFDLDVEEHQQTVTVKLKDEEEPQPSTTPPTRSYRTPSPESTSLVESAPILAQTLQASPETRHVTETIPFGGSRYLNNIASSSEVPSILATSVVPALDEVPPMTYSFGYRPMMTNLTINEYAIVETSTGVVAPPPGTYLTSYNKATLITDPKAPIGSTLTGQFATVNSTSSSDQQPTSFLGNSYSTLNDSVSYYTQKIFTKTASHDPRLNPNLNPPEDTVPAPPKKKVRKLKAPSIQDE